MTALSAAKDLVQYGVEVRPAHLPVVVPVKGSTVIYQGALVAQNGGYALPARNTSSNTDTIIGVALETVDNSSGSDGDLDLTKIKRGVFEFANSASTEAITASEIGKTVYAADDQTVSKTSNSSARVAAGICLGINGTKVIVQVG